MLTRIITWSLRRRFIVLGMTVLLVVGGVWAVMTTPVDAIPDLSDVQVIVMTEWPGQSPQLVEDQVTYPLSTEMLKVPRTKVVRGMSQFGLSGVFVVFEDGTDLYWARSRVLEYLNTVRDRLPAGAMPMLGPDATGVGWVMQYVVADTTGTRTLAELRGIQDWTLRPALNSVKGVAEIAALGGFEKQYQVEVDPAKLLAFDLSAGDVVQAVSVANENVSGRVLEQGGTEYVVQGIGRIRGSDDIREIALKADSRGAPVTVGDVANVQAGAELRRGISDYNGKGEVVTGFVVMRYGENPLGVIKRVKERMREIQSTLPNGVVIMNAYDRSTLITSAVHELRNKLLEEAIIVSIVTAIFLLHAPSALVAILMLPVGILMAMLAMRGMGMTANIMSLGGIALAIGVMIDGAIVMIENLHKHIEHAGVAPQDPNHPDAARESASGARWRIVGESAREVGPAIFVSLAIITLSFIPVFALQAQEGRLFHPLAWTKTLAMGAAAILSLTLVPVLMGFLVRGEVRPEQANPVNRVLMRLYHPLIELALRHRRSVVAGSVVLLAATALPWAGIGSEFMPPLNEGSIMDMPSLFPGVGPNQARQILQQRDRAIARQPEVQSVLGKIGRAETATDMAPMSMIESTIILKPREEWRPGVDQDSIIAQLNSTVRTPGVANMWSMPIKNRLEMLTTGIKTPVGIKIFGPDLRQIDRIGKNIEALLTPVAGTSAVFAEKAVGGRFLTVEIDRAAAARYGVSVQDIQMEMMTAVGGMSGGEVLEGRERYSLLIRYPRELRDDPEKVKNVLVHVPSGAQVSLGQLANVSVTPGPPLIKSENAALNGIVYVDVRNRDIGGYVREGQRKLQDKLQLPAGYRVEWSGQFEAMQRANRRLAFVVPVTLAMIFLLLLWHFGTIAETLIVMLSLPFALVGGVWLMWLLDFNLSVAAAIGFIALAGLAAETGVVMLLYLDHAYDARRKDGRVTNEQEVNEAVVLGAVERVRPKIMTVTAILAGLLPILWGHGAASDVMKRIAAPMVGGMISSTILTLLVIPAIYSLWKSSLLRGQRTHNSDVLTITSAQEAT